MKKKGLIALLLCLVMVMAAFTSCSKPKTIEEYVKNDADAMEEVQSAADSAGLDVSFSGNDVIYTYDLSSLDGVTEEVIKSDLMIEQLTAALDSTADTFAGLCKELEEQSKIEGIQIIVNYTFGDEVIVTKTFNASGAVS